MSYCKGKSRALRSMYYTEVGSAPRVGTPPEAFGAYFPCLQTSLARAVQDLQPMPCNTILAIREIPNVNSQIRIDDPIPS